MRRGPEIATLGEEMNPTISEIGYFASRLGNCSLKARTFLVSSRDQTSAREWKLRSPGVEGHVKDINASWLSCTTLMYFVQIQNFFHVGYQNGVDCFENLRMWELL